jgi:hypothetical protein
MIDSSANGRFSDQELNCLFRQYLPVQPLPADLATHLTVLVLAEVAIKLQGQAGAWRRPARRLLGRCGKFWLSFRYH